MKSGFHIVRQLFSFGWIGVVGFVVDAAVFTVVNVFLQNLYGARVISYLAAASTTWFLNRKFTFDQSNLSPWREWRRFILLQTAGGAVNYGVYAFLVSSYAVFTSFPIAAIAVGSVAGMAVNFTTAKFLVFESAARK